MAEPEVIIHQAGPLPIKVAWQAPRTGPATLVVAGSEWSKDVNVQVGVQVSLDGVPVGGAQIFSSGANTHRAVVPMHLPVELEKPRSDHDMPTYTVELFPMNASTLSDQNDWFQVVLLT
jgi:hypothetical protein